MAPELRDEWVSSHQVPEETRGQQWTGEMGQQAVIPEGEEQEAEVAQTQLDPSSMATTWSQSSRGKTTGAKEASASSSTGATCFQLEDSTPGGKGSGLSTPKQPPNEKGSNQKGTTSSKTNKKGSTEGTWLGVGDGSYSDGNVVDDES